MAEPMTITPRPLYKEDFDLGTQPGQTTTVDVMGAGAVSVTKVYFPVNVAAADDAAAALAGVPSRGLYYNTTLNYAVARAT